MRTDKELQEGVLKALDWEPSVNAAQIGVTVQRGVVTLTGQVGTLAEKSPPQLLVDAGGVGYEVDVPMSTFYNLPGLGEIAALRPATRVLLASFSGWIVLVLINAIVSREGGAGAGHDPWGGDSLEWFALSPPDPHNFDVLPDVRSDRPMRDIREAISHSTSRAEERPAPESQPGPARPLAK